MDSYTITVVVEYNPSADKWEYRVYDGYGTSEFGMQDAELMTKLVTGHVRRLVRENVEFVESSRVRM